ncbi:Ig-like domain-containing protein [Thalassobius sp. I31.1]|uniref:PKD domain-containing protein n=1 Tax=Thalassobius sp. I31.1 TaxID=2109912 RepID=UPI0013004583|nr:Ig-like domain-containing protein [Thalassobius sp. I31.1]
MKQNPLRNYTFAALTLGALSAGPAQALGGGSFFDVVEKPVGVTEALCNFNSYYDPGGAEAQVNLGNGSSGGNYWLSGVVQAWAPGDIQVSEIISRCNITGITNFVTDGANGTYAADAFVGVTFTGQYGGQWYDYKVGIQGASNTFYINSRTPITPPNTPPTADAGSDQSVASGAGVTLNGSASNANDVGQVLTYSWLQTGGVGVTLNDGTVASPVFTAPVVAIGDSEILTFRLIVNDGFVDSTLDTVAITVNGPANTPPTADAGSDQSVASGAGVTLNGSASDANDVGQVLTYSWLQTGGVGVTLNDGTVASPVFTAPVVAIGDSEILTFRLIVNDGFVDSTLDTVAITVNGPANTPPTADAGSDQSVASGAGVTLNGSASDANDVGQVLTYSWIQTGGISVLPSGSTAQNPAITVPDFPAGQPSHVLTFELTVNDGFEDSLVSTVTVTVNPPADITRPTVTLSGAPSMHDGTTLISLRIEFSEVVTGFAPEDIDVQNGNVVAFANFVTHHQILIRPSSAAQAVVVSVVENGVEDLSGNGNEASAPVSISGNTVEITQREVDEFLKQRGMLLTRAQPNLSRFLSSGTPGSFALNGSATRGHLNFATGSDARVWTNAMGIWSDEDGQKQSYAHLALGSHILTTDTLVIGAMAQFDRAYSTLTDSRIESTGYLIGPYFVARMSNQPLIFSGSLLHGRTQNDRTPTGQPTDQFDSTRTLATLGVEGSVDLERGIRMIPSLDVFYLNDKRHTYVDSTNTTIPEQEITQSTARLGLGFEIPLALETADVLLTPGISASFSDTRGAFSNESSSQWGAEMGAVFALSDKASITVDVFYDGIGDSTTDIYGGSLLFELKF